MVYLPTDEISFPDPRNYHPMGGLIAAGGDLSASRLLLSYQMGIFPWYEPEEEILWWCPDPRFVLFPDRLKVSKSMKKVLASNVLKVTENQAFEEVMRSCKSIKRKGQEGTWISNGLVSSFQKLHRSGVAHSVEVWNEDRLVGGLYGLIIGRVFCGESMFSLESNASKAGFITFIKRHLNDFDLIDCQVHSDHLESLGAEMITKEAFLSYLPFFNKEL